MAGRRTIRGDVAAARRPWLVASLVLVVASLVVFATHHDVLALTLLVAAFLAVAAAKRSG